MATNVTPSGDACTHTAHGAEVEAYPNWTTSGGSFGTIGIPAQYEGLVALGFHVFNVGDTFTVALPAPVSSGNLLELFFAIQPQQGFSWFATFEVRENNASGAIITTVTTIPAWQEIHIINHVIADTLSSICFLVTWKSPTAWTTIDALYVYWDMPPVSNNPPNPPSDLQASGEINPSQLIAYPTFSFQCNDPDSGDYAQYYQIQVSTDPLFGSIHWNSGKTQFSLAEYPPGVLEGTRCAEIAYGGPALVPGTVYYWRAKTWDDDDAEGSWDAEGAKFTLDVAPDPPTALRINGLITSPVLPEDVNFTFKCDDPDSGTYLRYYQIQISPNSSFSVITWDSAKTQFAEYPPGVLEGTRCGNIHHTVTELGLHRGIPYYWRARIWDAPGLVSLWSSEGAVPEIPHFSISSARAIWILIERDPDICFYRHRDALDCIGDRLSWPLLIDPGKVYSSVGFEGTAENANVSISLRPGPKFKELMTDPPLLCSCTTYQGLTPVFTGIIRTVDLLAGKIGVKA